MKRSPPRTRTKKTPPDWASFFALIVDVPEDFLSDRGDQSPQSRDAP